MAEPEKFTSWEAWETRCQQQGFEGPYQISGQPHMWQFVSKACGAAALWNAQHRTGYVFDGGRDNG